MSKEIKIPDARLANVFNEEVVKEIVKPTASTDNQNSEIDTVDKKTFILTKKVNNEYDRIRKQEDNLAKFGELTLKPNAEAVQEIVDKQKEYFEFARQSKVFLHEGFNKKVPFFPRNLIMMGAKTGSGKTTIVSNICYHTVLQGGRVLVITNEEVPGDFYSRIACLFKGWAYRNHDDMTPEQADTITDMITVLSQRISVVDDNYGGLDGVTTSPEGLRTLLDRVISKADGEFDCVLIDYYQGFFRSLQDKSMNRYDVQENVSELLYNYKDRIPCPLVILSQLKELTDEKTPFKERIEGRKVILNKATCAIEVIAEPENMRTSFSIKKARYAGTLGETVYSGFDKGKYIPYTKEFAMKQLMKQEQKDRAKVMGKVFEGKEK